MLICSAWTTGWPISWRFWNDDDVDGRLGCHSDCPLPASSTIAQATARWKATPRTGYYLFHIGLIVAIIIIIADKGHSYNHTVISVAVVFASYTTGVIQWLLKVCSGFPLTLKRTFLHNKIRSKASKIVSVIADDYMMNEYTSKILGQDTSIRPLFGR